MKKEELLQYPEISGKEIKEALDIAAGQTRFALSRFGGEFKNIFSTNNFYTKAPNDQWTNGFWTGELWLAYEYTGEEAFLKTALEQTESFRYRLDHEIATDTHDLGFLFPAWLPTS